MKFSWDISSLGTYAAYAMAAWHLLRWVIRRLNRMKKEAVPETAKSRRQSARFFAAFLMVLVMAAVLLLLLAVVSLQPSPQSRFLSVLAGIVAGLAVIVACVNAVGVPAYYHIVDLEKQFEALETRMKVTEVQMQAQAELLKEQFPVQPKLAFMENTAAGTSRDYTS